MIYLDSAATSLLKPDGVQYAVIEAMRTMASPGRGAHPAALKAAERCYECRENLAELFKVPKSENVVFTFNATHGLNIAIASLVARGGSVLISGYEHNSVTRPLAALNAAITVVDTPLFDAESLTAAFEKQIRLCDVAVFTHVSNAFGYVLPVEKLAKLCREAGKPFIIDASQSAGVLDIDFASLGADFIAMPGHKGLMGPQGTGVLLCKNEASPLLYGGSGSSSRLQQMPEILPDRLEAGTHNVAGIAGLNEGVKFLLRHGTENVRRHERALMDILAEELRSAGKLRVFYSPNERLQSGAISVLPENMYSEELSERLSENGIAVRAGLHCAPTAHKTVGTIDTGTVRISFSPFNSEDEVRSAACAIVNILKN